MRWAQINICVLGSFRFPNWQSFVWNYFRMRTVHWTGIHVQWSMAAVFNKRVATPTGSFPFTVRKCAVPTAHLCREISLSRISDSPGLISYIHRMAFVTLEPLYCLCVCMVAQHCMRTKTNLCLVYIFLREHCSDRPWTIFGGVASRFFMHTAVLLLVDRVLDGVFGIVCCCDWSPTRGTKNGWKQMLWENLLLHKKNLFWYELCWKYLNA